jgi:hypothetical protein
LAVTISAAELDEAPVDVPALVLVVVPVEAVLGEDEELQAAAVARMRAAGATNRIARLRVRRCMVMGLRVP